MEELIPLLIGVIWIAYSFYTRGRKKGTSEKRPVAAEKTSQSKEPSILEQILLGEEIRIAEPEPENDDYYEEEEVNESRFEEKKPEKRYRNAFLSTELANIKEEGQHAIRYQSVKSDGKTIILKEDDFEPVLDEDFDIRKAIIYEAILNPPYIDFK